ncbi:hypothetical protein OH460_08425 [Vibrio sp. Makdt]|uniref:hypothetical protein n=1 Tax=Vibrio sp. Makdt TaxID=2998828 RepID=UPI0022CD41FE|nr:hypothetical protein [Vibrio sp. Makdt]MDA0152325.1 hypothetical protein [Vibrio sp. Makdt]
MSKSDLKRVHRCIKGKHLQFYSTNDAEIEQKIKEWTLILDTLTFPWGVNSIKRKTANNGLPQNIHFKRTRKKLADGSYSYYDKIVLIIDRKSLGVYKTFSRRYGTTHTIEEAIDDVIERATTWWNRSEFASTTRKISVSIVE